MKVKVRFKHDMLQALQQAIEDFINYSSENDSDDEKLLGAVLFQVRMKIYDKLASYQQEYGIAFTPAEAIAMRIFQQYHPDVTTSLGNALHKLANEVHQKLIV